MSTDSDSDHDKKASLLSRPRRSTAGSRMSTLVGKALEDDETFWSHETWNDGGEDGAVSEDGSFRESDEDSADRVDTFDSDFNDSESDDESDDDGEEDRKLAMEEKNKTSSGYKDPKKAKGRGGKTGGSTLKNSQFDIERAGRHLVKRNKKKNGARVVGEGINAGLVLNLQGLQDFLATNGSVKPPSHSSAVVAQKPGVVAAASTRIVASKSVSSVPKPASPAPALSCGSVVQTRRSVRSRNEPLTSSSSASPPLSKSQPLASPISSSRIETRRSLRAATLTKTIETKKSVKRATRETQKRQAAIRSRIRKNPTKKFYSQEELLLEAVQETEFENKRWILGRKRVRDRADAFEKLAEWERRMGLGGIRGGGNVVCKYHSRRGAVNTLTFPDMDLVPEILCRKRKLSPSGTNSRNDKNVCVITGKEARYRDPKTMKKYHDSAAFKELRRRYDAGEALDQGPSSNFSSQLVPKPVQSCSSPRPDTKEKMNTDGAKSVKDKTTKTKVVAGVGAAKTVPSISILPAKSTRGRLVKPTRKLAEALPLELPEVATSDAQNPVKIPINKTSQKGKVTSKANEKFKVEVRSPPILPSDVAVGSMTEVAACAPQTVLSNNMSKVQSASGAEVSLAPTQSLHHRQLGKTNQTTKTTNNFADPPSDSLHKNSASGAPASDLNDSAAVDSAKHASQSEFVPPASAPTTPRKSPKTKRPRVSSSTVSSAGTKKSAPEPDHVIALDETVPLPPQSSLSKVTANGGKASSVVPPMYNVEGYQQFSFSVPSGQLGTSSMGEQETSDTNPIKSAGKANNVSSIPFSPLELHTSPVTVSAEQLQLQHHLIQHYHSGQQSADPPVVEGPTLLNPSYYPFAPNPHFQTQNLPLHPFNPQLTSAHAQQFQAALLPTPQSMSLYQSLLDVPPASPSASANDAAMIRNALSAYSAMQQSSEIPKEHRPEQSDQNE